LQGMAVKPLTRPGPPNTPHAQNGQSTPFDVDCTKRKCSEGNG